MSNGLIFLTQEERDRLASWCEAEAASKERLAEVLKTQEGLGRMRDVLVSRHNAERLACMVVAKLLRSIEDG